MTAPDQAAEQPAVLTEVRGRVLVITMNRPDARNAINGAMVTGLLAAIEELDTTDELSVGVLTGAGRGFCSGMDLKAFAKERTPKLWTLQEPLFTKVFRSADAKEGPRAFAEKRTPNWSAS